MKKIFLGSLFFITTNVFSQFSNLIIFGDSLSDSGNFPETVSAWVDLNKPKNIGNLYASYYVPFSNPVDTQSPIFTVPGTDKQFLWPIVAHNYQFPQMRIGHFQQMRAYSSFDWTQLFLSMAYADGLTKSNIVVPNLILHYQEIPKDASVSYAAGFATSFKNCRNPHYQIIQPCTLNTILARQSIYRNNPTQAHYKIIQVPGLYKQVDLFLQDIKNKSVIVNQNTLYVFWSGGNDIIIADNALLTHWNPIPAIFYLFGETGFHIVSNIRHLVKQLPENTRPHFIYVNTSFNPELTPFAYNTTNGKMGKYATKVSNFWLTLDAHIFNLFSSTKIVIVPVYEWYQTAAKSDYFKSKMGKACQLDAGDYNNPVAIPSGNCSGYLFWNAVHPSVFMNALMAYHLLRYLKNDGSES